jgi:hypothetical protein
MMERDRGKEEDRDCCLKVTKKDKSCGGGGSMTGREGIRPVDSSPCLRKWGSCSCACNRQTDALGLSCGKRTPPLLRRSESLVLQLNSPKKTIGRRKNYSEEEI